MNTVVPRPDESTEHSGPVLHDTGKVRVVDCSACGHAHVDPMPTEEQLSDFYSTEFLDEVKPEYLEKTERELEYWDSVVHATKQRRMRRLVGGPGRILDVGSCGGFLLRYFRDKGWDILGVEPSDQAARWSRQRYGVPVIQKLFEQVDHDDLGTFDAIHMAFVLEHVRRPREILARAHELLRPGGCLCVEVPNDFNPLQEAVVRGLGKDRWWVTLPDHLNYFTFESLERTLEAAGFEPVRRDTTFPMELFVLMGEDYIDNDEVGRRCHLKRMGLETSLVEADVEDPVDMLYGGFASRGLGRVAIVYAQKEGRT